MAIDQPPSRWQRVWNEEEMEKFYRSRVRPMQEAAEALGWALAVHGTMQRDLDLIAVPWTDQHAQKDALARAVMLAACGFEQSAYQWEAKPIGRSATSFPICWTEFGMNKAGMGHADLSVIESAAPSETGWIACKDRLPPDEKPVVGLWETDPKDGWATKQTCYYNGIYWMTWNTGTFDARLVWPTHWMPLPEAPK